MKSKESSMEYGNQHHALNFPIFPRNSGTRNKKQRVVIATKKDMQYAFGVLKIIEINVHKSHPSPQKKRRWKTTMHIWLLSFSLLLGCLCMFLYGYRQHHNCNWGITVQTQRESIPFVSFVLGHQLPPSIV